MQEKLEMAGRIKDVLLAGSTGLLSQDTVARLDAKLRGLLDLDEVELNPKIIASPVGPEVQQPALPVGRKATESVLIEHKRQMGFVHEDMQDLYEDLKKDYTINEFVGFNVHQYRDDIIASIREDTFKKRHLPEVRDPSTGEVIREETEYEIEGVKVGKLRKALIAAFEEQKTVTQLAREIEDFVQDITFQNGTTLPAELRSFFIARTEVTRAAARGQLRNYRGLEYDMVEWITVLDGRQDDDCQALDGKLFNIDESDGMIPLHVNCRCRFVPQKKTD